MPSELVQVADAADADGETCVLPDVFDAEIGKRRLHLVVLGVVDRVGPTEVRVDAHGIDEVIRAPRLYVGADRRWRMHRRDHGEGNMPPLLP